MHGNDSPFLDIRRSAIRFRPVLWSAPEVSTRVRSGKSLLPYIAQWSMGGTQPTASEVAGLCCRRTAECPACDADKMSLCVSLSEHALALPSEQLGELRR